VHLLWKRYSRSGYAAPWFYALMALAFAGLIALAIVMQDWLVAAVALTMVPVTAAGSRMMRRLNEAERESREARRAQEEDGDE